MVPTKRPARAPPDALKRRSKIKAPAFGGSQGRREKRGFMLYCPLLPAAGSVGYYYPRGIPAGGSQVDRVTKNKIAPRFVLEVFIG